MCRALKFILLASCAVFRGGLVPSVSAADDVSADELEKLAEQGPLLVNNYIPVTMQILHHCIEMIQYEPVMGAPGTDASGKPTTTTRRPTTTTSTTTSPPETTASSTAKPVALLNVEFLDHLPLKLLQDFNGEPYEPLALRPEDNANEFRRLYDDSYRGPVPPVVEEKATKKGGKKRVPPTKPYLHMLVLYDLLKREAKNSMFNFYVGYSEAILEEMYQMNFPSAKEQLQFALTQLLERKDVTKSDVVSRTKQMIKDLDTKNSAIAFALELVPPLVFGL
ncbi:AGAP003032-PA-like protein [Anopheles sinensis]|uniref:AGAP003032-PA-like protein n=1 Tax=Anopheles sinensis TaxID=74873 RepID=A0A084VRE3_ANOSI|nr:AGAP003032-PA-like protein [Anopheles sinensis]